MTAPPRKEGCCYEKVFQELLSAADLPVPVRAYRCADDLFVQRFQIAPPVERLYDRWYVELFRDADILHSLYVTLLVAVAAAAIATVLGTIAAIGIHNMGRRAKAAYLTVNNIPMSSSDTIMGVTFMLLFAAIGLDKGYLTLILAHVTFCTPYVVLNVMPKLRQLDKNAYEAALDLGATPHQALHKVILPEIMPGIVTGAIMAFTMSIDDFVVSYFTAGHDQPAAVGRDLLDDPPPHDTEDQRHLDHSAF